MNSMRFITQAVEFEAKRQIAILEDGGTIEQETRLYDPNRGETRSMRSKEEAHDYRYFPDPDLLPLELDDAWIDAIGAALPELPDAKKARFVADFGLPEYDAGVLTAETANAGYFEAVAAGRDGKQAANWVINELFGRLNKEGHGIEASPVDPGAARRADRSGRRRARSRARSPRTCSRSSGPRAAIRRRSSPSAALQQVTDTGAIEAAVAEVIAANPDKAAQARAKPSLAGWFVGQVMKATGGKANPQAVNASGEGEARDRVAGLGGGTMTHYDYKVIPAPKKVKRVKGVSGAEELFAVTLTDAINEVARQGWEYVRAEHLPAEAPRGWLRAAVTDEQAVLVFRRPRESLAPRLATVRAEAPAIDAAAGAGGAAGGAAAERGGRRPAEDAASAGPSRR